MAGRDLGRVLVVTETMWLVCFEQLVSQITRPVESHQIAIKQPVHVSVSLYWRPREPFPASAQLFGCLLRRRTTTQFNQENDSDYPMGCEFHILNCTTAQVVTKSPSHQRRPLSTAGWEF